MKLLLFVDPELTILLLTALRYERRSLLNFLHLSDGFLNRLLRHYLGLLILCLALKALLFSELQASL